MATTGFGDFTYGAPFPPDSFGLKLGAPIRVVLNAANLFSGPTTVPASGTLVSGIIDTHDYSSLAFGLTAPSAISVSIQRYLDVEGTIHAGAAVTLAATTNGAVAIPFSPLFESVKITLSNAGSSAVTLTKAQLVCRAVNI